LAQQEDTFRTLLISRFQNIIAGQIGNKSEAETTKKILRVWSRPFPGKTYDKKFFPDLT
jgi:hypothetical protein